MSSTPDAPRRSAIKQLAKQVAPYLPAGVRELAVPKQWSYSAKEQAQVARPEKNNYNGALSPSVFVGMQNPCAQSYLYARAIEDTSEARGKGKTEAVSLQMQAEGARHWPSDVTVPDRVLLYSDKWGQKQKEALTRQFTHVIVESGKPLMGRAHDHDVYRDVDSMLEAGRKVALLSYGSEIRTPSIHREVEPYSPFQYDLDGLTERLVKTTDFVHKFLDHYGELVEFVDTPDLLVYRPNAVWVPTLINEAVWLTGENLALANRSSHDKLAVLHTPTNPHLKGSQYILEPMRKLAGDGLIDFREPTMMEPVDVPKHVADADVVIDQVAMGLYGIASMEAMALGKLVIAQVWDRNRKIIKEQTGCDLPIIQATPDTIGDVVQDIARNPEKYEHLKQAGRDFVTEVHSKERVASIFHEHFIGV